MARLTQYDESQAAKRLRVPVAAYRWSRHAGVIPAPDASSSHWSRPAVEAMAPEAIRTSLPREPISAAVAADLIAQALGTPNLPDDPPAVSAFAVRRLIRLGLLANLSADPDAVLVNPDQVAAVCAIPDLAPRLAAEAPLGPDQSAARLGVRRVDFDYMLTLKWVEPVERRKVSFGTSKAGAVTVPIFRTADIDALPGAHPEIDWQQLVAVHKGQRSPLAALAREAAEAS
ncbi:MULTISPECIES: hypothetical protein [Streptomyces]|uniref:hypothetical protein n=1 Tax=Streptomyces TaxID=1883 RepID=UPI001968F6A0|nr:MULTISPECIES: hypothetical protein [Streptomyces]MDX3064746.1 hypothetical protein [Streptomyces sp. ND04-05B]MDX3519612.1 hypothetical protein [Streptomyces scabiei]